LDIRIIVLSPNTQILSGCVHPDHDTDSTVARFLVQIDSCHEAGVDLKVEEMVNLPKRLLLAGGSLADETERFSTLPEKLQRTLHSFQAGPETQHCLHERDTKLSGNSLNITRESRALLVCYSI
jgi:hypothetical protein